MGGDLALVLGAQREAMVADALQRLAGRPEFVGQSERLRAALTTVQEALTRAAEGDEPALAAALRAVAQRAGEPGLGYSQAQVLLSALCTEAVEALRRTLPATTCRAATVALRALLGPAMLGLAAVVHDAPAVPEGIGK